MSDQFTRLLTFISNLERSNSDNMSPWETGSLHYFTTPSWSTGTSSSGANNAGEPLKEDSTTNIGSSSSKSSHHSNKTTIIAIVVAVVAVLILLTAFVCLIRCCYRRRSRKLAGRKDPALGGGLLNRGWQKVDGEEKLGDEDFGSMSYNARDRLINQDVPTYNARDMAYEPFRPHGQDA
jgi:hypothetical protein